MIKFIFLLFILYVFIYNTIQTKVTIEPFEIFHTCPKSFNCKNEMTTSGFAILLHAKPKPKTIPEMMMIRYLLVDLFMVSPLRMKQEGLFQSPPP